MCVPGSGCYPIRELFIPSMTSVSMKQYDGNEISQTPLGFCWLRISQMTRRGEGGPCLAYLPRAGENPATQEDSKSPPSPKGAQAALKHDTSQTFPVKPSSLLPIRTTMASSLLPDAVSMSTVPAGNTARFRRSGRIDFCSFLAQQKSRHTFHPFDCIPNVS